MNHRHMIFPIVVIICLIAGPISAISEETQEQKKTVKFFMLFDSISLALETWDQVTPPDTVKLKAYAVASGYLAGIPYHFEKRRNKISIYEQVDKAATDLTYEGWSRQEDALRFDYMFSVPYAVFERATSRAPVKGHGVSELTALAPAREEAKKEALRNAIRNQLNSEFTRKNKPIPGVVDGRITWYEISNEGRDPESGLYFVDIEAYITINANTRSTTSNPAQ